MLFPITTPLLPYSSIPSLLRPPAAGGSGAPVTLLEKSDEIGYLLTRLTVGEIMTYFPVTIGADRLMAEAVKRMLAYKVEALPVVEHDKLIGIVTRTNLLQAFLQAQAALPVAA